MMWFEYSKINVICPCGEGVFFITSKFFVLHSHDQLWRQTWNYYGKQYIYFANSACRILLMLRMCVIPSPLYSIQWSCIDVHTYAIYGYFWMWPSAYCNTYSTYIHREMQLYTVISLGVVCFVLDLAFSELVVRINRWTAFHVIMHLQFQNLQY